VNVVDSCGWLEYFAAGPNADFFADALETTAELVVPTVTIYEVFKRVYVQKGEGDALMAAALMQQGRVSDLTVHLSLEASKASMVFGLAMADAVILATARSAEATLWTQDAHFEGLDGVRYVAARV